MVLIVAGMFLTSIDAQAQTAVPFNPGKRVALLVGNDDYRGGKPGSDKNDWRRLNNAVNDAKALGKRLRQLGFDVDVQTNLTKDQLTDAVARLVKRGEGAQAVLFYFAGHGAGLKDGHNYLMPVNAAKVDESFISVRNDGVKLEAIAAPLAAIKGGTKIILLDACRSLPIVNRNGAAMGGHIAIAMPPDDTVIGFATQAGEPASEAGDGNGPYVRALLKGLAGNQLNLAKVMAVASAEFKGSKSGQRPMNYADQDTLESFWFAAPQQVVDARVAEVLRENQELKRRVQSAPQATAIPLPAVAPTIASARTLLPDCDVCPIMVALPGQRYQRGALPNEKGSADDERPVRWVTVKPFAIGKYEVTQDQWQAVMGSNPSKFKDCGPDCPVSGVSWNDAQAYIAKLNARTGNRFGYRLPSEAEWEMAARGDTTTAYHTGNSISGKQANFDDSHSVLPFVGINLDKTVKVGSYSPNPFGLHDMLGNVWEWTQDCYGGAEISMNGRKPTVIGSYYLAPTDGSAYQPVDKAKDCQRVLRGGGHGVPSSGLRSASRTPAGNYKWLDKNCYIGFDIGFRLARPIF